MFSSSPKFRWHQGPHWERFFQAYDKIVMDSLGDTCVSKQLHHPRFGSTMVHVIGDSSKDPVFFFHAMGACSLMYSDWLIPKLREQHKYFLVLIDTPGDIGRSLPKDHDMNNVPADKKEFSEWFLDLKRQLGVIKKPVSLIGYSFGSFLATQLALVVPNEVKKLILIAPAAVFSGIEGGWMMRIMLLIIGSCLSPTESMRDSFYDNFMTYMQPDFIEQRKQWSSERAELKAASRKMKPVIRMNPEEIEIKSLKEIATRHPTLLIIGSNERVTNATRAVQRAKDAGVKVKLYDDAGHMLYSEHPASELAVGDVIDFLRD